MTSTAEARAAEKSTDGAEELFAGITDIAKALKIDPKTAKNWVEKGYLEDAGVPTVMHRGGKPLVAALVLERYRQRLFPTA